MIKILVIDDYKVKRDKIINSITTYHDILPENITQVTCVKDGRRELYNQHFDLMILDLVLPIEDGGECDAINCIKFLKEISINPSINPPIHIVGISGYKDKVSEFNTDFTEKLWNLINYDESSAEWEDKLNSLIFHLLKTRQQFLQASFSTQSGAIIQQLEHNQLPNTILGFNWSEVANGLANIVEKSLVIPSKFSNGSKAKNVNLTNIKISSEYDFQNLIHLILRPWIPSVEAENIAIIFDGNTKNADFSIKGNSLIIEAKYIDTTGKKNDVLKTLDGLSNFYGKNANVKALLFLILINKKVEIDKHKIETEFSKNTSPSITVKVIYNELE